MDNDANGTSCWRLSARWTWTHTSPRKCCYGIECDLLSIVHVIVVARSKKLASLLSPTAFTFGADFIADYEYAGVGAGWGNFSEGEYSLRTSIHMMLVDALLYGLLAWCLDKVKPPSQGLRQTRPERALFC